MNELALFAGAGGGILGENFLDGEQSAPSSGNPTPQVFLPPDKTTRFWNLSRYGMTCKPLTEPVARELLTLFRRVFHPSLLVQMEKSRDRWRQKFYVVSNGENR